jgi:NAD-dependent SIR2 family protein deacetylase
MAKCYGCGKESKGNMPTAKIGGEERSYCADCYWKVEKEYKGKKNCDECSYFGEESCKKKGKKIKPVTVGYNQYFVDAEKCGDFSTDKDVAVAEIKKLEAQGKFEEAAAGYARWGMNEEAEAARKKIPKLSVNAGDLVKNLAKTGQTLTYYCPHCGVQLKIGAKATQIPKFCTTCKGDLTLLDLGKFIEQHAS